MKSLYQWWTVMNNEHALIMAIGIILYNVRPDGREK
jgi:hypothetical protein